MPRVQRNAERYQFLRWGQGASTASSPGTGMSTSTRVTASSSPMKLTASPRPTSHTCVGTDPTPPWSTGWASWLGRGRHRGRGRWVSPSPCHPQGGTKLSRRHPRRRATATDVVLTITEMLRAHGVVGNLSSSTASVAGVPLANRATIGNMSSRVHPSPQSSSDRRGHRVYLHRPAA